MNKTKHEAQHVPEYSTERETNRLSLCRGGCSKRMEKGASKAPEKGCLSQWSVFTEGKKWGWTQRTHLVFLKESKEAEEITGCGK